ncbi:MULTISPECIES: DUF443 family protein [unclassified Streptococcus]|uniref:DUF443 family protein n=1 Tax=unclassified Streptococcus TaxID=2608887 RepID=UPI001072E231|nr:MULTISPECIES: DUF443 family protein [unclassified Streptococcus]MBF0787327.1 DUF443 family protein [Streptococcus sp. 19428wC2_LYSM12]MCQ9212666.1 DUF443 family protein [Streptococcus sp. B01]MCQ9214006.1 DUF443 family protein [Streptococcus sp. O1]TFV05811.1 DUF443 family protein [Streptococcus sp. LYSM12]
MSIINLYAIKLQPRYKLFEHGGNHYIVDIENGLITFLFPILGPLFKKRIYLVSQQDYINLKTDVLSTKEVNKFISPPFYISLGAAVFARMVPDGFGTISYISNLLFYLFIVLAIIFLRIYFYRKSLLMKQFITKPVGKTILRCKDISILILWWLSLVMLFCFVVLSKIILLENEHNLIYHFLNGFSLLGYFIFALGYYTKIEYEIDM